MHRLFLALALLLALVATAPGHAIPQATAGAGSPPIAKVEISPSRIDWTPVLSEGYEQVALTVVGPEGFVFEKRFPRGTPPAFELGEVRDRTLPDGAYSYELRTMGKGAGQVQSGFFSVRGGSLFVPAAGVRGTEPPTADRKPSGPPLQPKTITTSGECIGAGCVAGDEGTPLRLKDANALRLDFTDGPSAFTNNHSWAIQANDLFLGGGTYLAVKDVDNSTTPFTITANAPDNALFVSSSGNVGLGTATPTVKLDAKATLPGDVVAQLQNLSSTGYSGIDYLNAAGLTVAFFGVDNAAATTRLNSLQGYPVVLLTRSVERMRITADGDVGIGTASPSDRLDVECSTASKACLTVHNSNASGFSGLEAFEESGVSSLFLGVDNFNNADRLNYLNGFDLRFLANGTERLRFNNSGNVITAVSGAFLSNGGVWNNASSREVKKDITDLGTSEALQAFEHLNPVKFRYKTEPDQQYVGFIAEDVPDLVARNDRKSLSPMDIVAVLTKVVQEQQKTIEALAAKVDELERAKPK